MAGIGACLAQRRKEAMTVRGRRRKEKRRDQRVEIRARFLVRLDLAHSKRLRVVVPDIRCARTLHGHRSIRGS
jgi:hypothetical protein